MKLSPMIAAFGRMFPLDKLGHFAAGTIIWCVVYPFIGSWIAVGIASAIGIAKECVDKTEGSGRPDVWDALATIAGAALPALSGFMKNMVG